MDQSKGAAKGAGANSPVAAERGYRYHREQWGPGTHPVDAGQFFACAH